MSDNQNEKIHLGNVFFQSVQLVLFLKENNIDCQQLLDRHANADHGDIDDNLKHYLYHARCLGLDVFSLYRVLPDVRINIYTYRKEGRTVFRLSDFSRIS